MVMSLSIPKLASSALRGGNKKNNDINTICRQPVSDDQEAPETLSQPVSTPSTPTSATISEALRNNPFGITSRSRVIDAAAAESIGRDVEAKQKELRELNDALVTLAQLFPDVRIEVFRELLIRFDGNSRLHVCVEQLLRYKKEWVRGRWNVPVEQADGKKEVRGSVYATSDEASDADGGLVHPEELFRCEEYRSAVKNALCKEFVALNRSAVEAVLAEVNFSYTRARPTLKELSQKSWRVTISSLNPFKRKKEKGDSPFVTWDRSTDGELFPRLKETGSEELDRELYDTILAPLVLEKRQAQEIRDSKYAEELNESEANAVGALYECQCCLDEVTFEQISTCSTDSHIICYHCIQRTLHEALFGQGWDKSIDSGKATLKCLAPLSHGSCEGYLSPQLVKRAVLSDRAGVETYRKFEDRIATGTLLESHLKLVRCPFCSYAEVDPVFHPPKEGLVWQFRRGSIISTILTTVFLLDLIPLLIIPVLLLILFYPNSVAAIFRNALRNLCLRQRSQRFSCRNPACKRDSCLTCHKAWRDPHVCHEPLLLSLRTTVEAARTAAIKRTCPRCGLSFVKASGCNKLTCVCGYSMCYLCRKALGKPIQRGRLQPQLVLRRIPEDDHLGADDDEAAEGYKHFCEHFRINPGTRCTECNKCDLYLAEDEEAIARKAGEKAERDWRTRQSLLANTKNNTTTTTSSSSSSSSSTSPKEHTDDYPWDNSQHHLAVLAGNYQPWRSQYRYWLDDVWREGRWKWEIQAVVDWIVERVVVVHV
jgi:hypothetical protein